MTHRLQLEVCLDSPHGLITAIEAGADRIELCSSLSLQGLTPSPGLMRQAAGFETPVYAMIRPRPGDFVFSQTEVDAMLHEIDAVRAAGLAGVVLGASRPSGELDTQVLETLIRNAQGMGATLQRAVDLTPDLGVALEEAIALGFERVLTSGGALSAPEGADVIAGLVEQAKGRISVMAGAGLKPSNVAEIIRRTGVSEVHGSFSRTAPDAPYQGEAATRALAMGFVMPGLKEPDPDAISAVVATLRGLERGGL